MFTQVMLSTDLSNGMMVPTLAGTELTVSIMDGMVQIMIMLMLVLLILKQTMVLFMLLMLYS